MKKLIAGLMLVPCMAMAEFKTGNELLNNIKSDSIVENMVALGYIMGVADATRGSVHCGPAGVTAGQMRDMVKNHLEATPELRHYTADIIIGYVFKRAWPCATKSNGRPV